MTLDELLRTSFMSHAIVACDGGRPDREVTWCVPEGALKFGNYIMPGLLLIAERPLVEGPLSDAATLAAWTGRLAAVDASGVVLLCDGPAPEALVGALRDAGIALFLMPESTNVVSFMKRFVSAFSSSEADAFRQHEWLRDVAYGSSFGGDEVTAEQYGYDPESRYYCMIFSPRGAGESVVQSEMDATSLRHCVERRFSNERACVLSFVERSRNVVAFVPWPDDGDTRGLRDAVTDALSFEVRALSSSTWHVAVGGMARRLPEFHDSYEAAVRTLGVTRALGVHEKASFYEDWYMHMLLLKEPREELRTHMEHTLRPIMDSPDLLDTLANYLVFGENLKVTSEKMLIHVNTLKYRLNKISELLGVDLREPNIRFRLRMAITIERFLRS